MVDFRGSSMIGELRKGRMDETYIKVAGEWKYLYRAVDREGDTVDFLLTAKRDLAAVRRFLERAINLHDLPEKITIDKSGVSTVAIESVKADCCVDIQLRQSKYLNNIVKQDHRAVKRITRPMMGFKSFRCACVLIAGIETMHMIRKGQLSCPAGQSHVGSSAVLHPGNLIAKPTAQLLSATRHYCDKTNQAVSIDPGRSLPGLWCCRGGTIFAGRGAFLQKAHPDCDQHGPAANEVNSDHQS